MVRNRREVGRGRPRRTPDTAEASSAVLTPITKFLRPVEKGTKAAASAPVTLKTEEATLSPPQHKIKMLPPREQQSRGQQQVLKEASQPSICSFFSVRRSSRRPGKTLAEERLKNLQEAVAALTEEHLTVCNFDGKGRGVVSSRDIEKGELVVEYSGELIEMQEAKRREMSYSSDQNTGCYMYYFSHRASQFCVDATAESGRLGRLVNHSRNGNLQPRTVEVKCRPRLILVAKQRIVAGDELLYDYGDRSREALKNHPWLAS